MNELQNFLRIHNDWESILTQPPYNLKVSRDGNYIMFKYSQIASDFSIPLVREARGIIFREDKNFECVCRPFDKFGNYGESYVPEIDWDSASVQTKIDGSLMKVWYDGGAWHVSTNGTIDAFKAELNDAKYHSFGDLFMSVWELNDNEDATLHPDFTYMFELVSPHNKVVIPYDKTKLYFLGFRDTKTGEEFMPEGSIVADLFDIPERLSLAAPSLDAVREIAEKLPWSEEGYVVCDGMFNRIKVKSPAYVAAHYLVTGHVNSVSRLIDIILSGEEEEFLTYGAEYKDEITELKNLIASFTLEAMKFAEKYKNLSSVKEVALAVDKDNVRKPYRDFIFRNYRENITFTEWTSGWNGEKWAKALGKGE